MATAYVPAEFKIFDGHHGVISKLLDAERDASRSTNDPREANKVRNFF